MKRITLCSIAGLVLLSIGVAVLVSCNSSSNAPTEPQVLTLGSPEEIAQQIAEIGDFIEIIDSSQMTLRLNLDRGSAMRLSRRAIEVGRSIVSLNNKLAGNGFEVTDPTTLVAEIAVLEPFFVSVAQQANDGEEAAYRDPVAAATAVELHCPTKNYASRFWNSVAEVRNHLLSIGFHRVPNYATSVDGPDGFSPVDFSVFINSNDTYGWCGFGIYRTEAAIVRFGDKYTYYIQVCEPNPEVLSYRWYPCPGAWWPGFVAWWHYSYCN